MEWIDFKAVKNLVGFSRVLDHYGISLKGSTQLRGPCPLPTHNSKDSRWSFNVNLERDIWCCKSASCIAARNGKEGGNILDFICVMEKCSLKDGATKIVQWFGQPNGEKKPEPKKPETKQPDLGGHLPETVAKDLPYMQQVEQWWAKLHKLQPNESDEDYHKRVLNGIKSKLLESWRAGKAAAKHPTPAH